MQRSGPTVHLTAEAKLHGESELGSLHLAARPDSDRLLSLIGVASLTSCFWDLLTVQSPSLSISSPREEEMSAGDMV